MPSGKMLTKMGTIVAVAALFSACPGEDAPPPQTTADPVAFDTAPATMTPVTPAPGADTLPGATDPGAPGAPAAPGATAQPGTAPAAPAQQQPAQQPPAQQAQATGNVQAGQQVYAGAGLCFTCHGPAAAGTALGPNLTYGQWIWFTGPPSLDEMVTILRTGVTTPRQYPAPMPAMGGGNLNETQRRDLAAYVLSLNR
jgi:mono/diheme cytochrome c family protein